MGTRLLYFCFPMRYRSSQAMSGVRVCYMQEGPTSKWPQPPLGVDEKVVLKKKIKKFVEKGYIAPILGQLGFLMLSPKGSSRASNKIGGQCSMPAPTS
jgi:hypothetical protein